MIRIEVRLKAFDERELLNRIRWCGFITSQEYKSLRGMLGTIGDDEAFDFLLKDSKYEPISRFFSLNNRHRKKEIDGQYGRLQEVGVYDDIHNSLILVPDKWIYSIRLCRDYWSCGEEYVF